MSCFHTNTNNDMIKACRIIGVLIILFSFLPLGPGVYFYNKTCNFLKTAVKTQGIVSEIEERKDSEGNITYCPVISYIDNNGREYKKYGFGSFPPKYEIGDKVTIFYDPQKPQKAKFDSLISLWLGPVIGGVLGIIPLIIGLFFVFVFPVIIKRTVPEEKNNSQPGTAYSQIDSDTEQKAFKEAESSEQQSSTWNILCHLSSLIGYLGIPFGNIIMPLVIWLIKKDEYPMIDVHAKESLNFQISMTIYTIFSIFLCFILVGFIILPLLSVLNIVFVIIASVKANRSEVYRYPLTLRFIK